MTRSSSWSQLLRAGDGSTGWVYSLGAVHPWLIACYPEEAQQEVWSEDRDAIAAVSYAPTGKAVAGQRRLPAHWPVQLCQRL